MYSKVDTPKKVTEKWLKAAFAPLSDYLEREFPEEAGKILPYMMFYCNEEQRFYYKNRMTRDRIIFDQAGQLVLCGEEALRYDFEYLRGEKVNRPPNEERFVHPNVTRWIRRKLSKKAQVKYGEEVTIYLQELWGPIVNYDFEDMEVGLPLRGAHLRYCLYLYPTGIAKKLAVQFVGDEIVERRCSYAEYQEYEWRQNELVCEGWHVLSITQELLDYNSDILRQYLSKIV